MKKKIFFSLVCILILGMITGCNNSDSSRSYIKKYKKFFNYTFNKNWDYTAEENSYTDDMWGNNYLYKL